MYRLLDDIGPFPDGSVLAKGTLHTLDFLTPKTVQALLEHDRIAEWHSPPLAVLPGWERKAKVFAEAGVVTVSDLLEADQDELAEGLEIPAATLEQCLEEVEDWIE